MNIDKDEFWKILERYRSGRASQEEERFIHAYYELFETEDDGLGSLTEREREQIKNGIFGELQTKIKEDSENRFMRSRIARYAGAAAAVLILTFSIGFYFYNEKLAGPKADHSIARVAAGKISPGGNKAILTLDNGAAIVLDNTEEGLVARQGDTKINKTAEGQVEYQAGLNDGENGRSGVPCFNTITTPRGGQYRLRLQDGTDVWLNSASSIRFPVAFAPGKRVVEITGEAYFEVAKMITGNRAPFIVRSAGQEVEVLGTHFNINAYEDEGGTRTSLLEGSIRVKNAGGTSGKVLLPGQQSFVGRGGSRVEVQDDADMEAAVAWKNGYFKFDRQSLPEIMRQVSRWYDVDVEYAGQVPEDVYMGKIRRSGEVSGVLRILRLSGVNFKIEGRKIIVMN